jgi:hypothetical protein
MPQAYQEGSRACGEMGLERGLELEWGLELELEVSRYHV